MDSSKIASLNKPKSTIASRRPMLNSQRSCSALSINVSATHKDLMRRNSSTVTSARRNQYHTPPLPLPTSANMSPEELSSKIADSFQQFSSMLTQLSSNTNHTKSDHKCAPPNDSNKPIITPPPSSLPMSALTPSPSPSLSQIQSVATNNLMTPTSITTVRTKDKYDQEEEEEEDDDEEEDKLAFHSHATYFQNALDDVGDTRLRHRLVTKWFNHAACIGDSHTLKQMLNELTVDINASDNKKTGTNALMYASYFGHLDCVQLLLKQPTLKLNHSDKSGWTALIWAINGRQVDIVQLLLNEGAEKQTVVTKQGRSVFQFDTSKAIKKLLGPAPSLKPKKPKEKAPMGSPTTPVPVLQRAKSIIMADGMDYYHQSSDYSYFVNNHSNGPRSTPNKVPVSPPDLSQLSQSIPSPQQEQRLKDMDPTVSTMDMTAEEEEDLRKWQASIRSSNTFIWDRCLPDQMFVFSLEDMHLVVDYALQATNAGALRNQSKLSSALWQPANIVFLCARFAHYFYTREILGNLLNTVAIKLSRILKIASRETETLAYWIANICQLSSYLKRDLGLSVSTKDAQETLSERISEAYTYFVTESQKRLEKTLESSMLDYESIEEQVEFADDWQRFFRRSSSNLSQPSVHQPNRKSVDIVTASASTVIERKHSLDLSSSSSSSSSPNKIPFSSSVPSPQTMNALLLHAQSTLQAYHVPPAIVIQALAQLFHYLSCELFNRVLTYKKYLCRSKALQVRMNISVIEDWVHTQKLPPTLNQSFEPLVQLLQLLQCLSQMEDVHMFEATINAFDQLNILQIKRCVQNYRYEVSETRLPEEVEKWVTQQQQQPLTMKTSSVEHLVQRERPTSISSLSSLLDHPKQGVVVAKDGSTASAATTASPTPAAVPVAVVDYQAAEKRNAKYLLPFSIPVTTALLQGWTEQTHKQNKTSKEDPMLYSDAIYKEIKLKKQQDHNLLDKIFPTISEEWLHQLDKRLGIR